MFRSFLVPLDGSSFGEHALPLALSIAQRAGAKIQLLHVHRPLTEVFPEFAPAFQDGSLAGGLKTRQRAYLDALVDRCRTVSSVPVSCVVKEGAIAPTIREHVAEAGIDLVVMTTHGRGAVGRFWLGSVADELLRDLSVPLLLVRPGEQAPDLRSEPAVKRMLLPLDGSPFAEQMLEPAIALSKLLNIEINLLRVVQPILLGTAAMEGVAVGQAGEQVVRQLEELEANAIREARQYLEGVCKRLREQGVLWVHEEVISADPTATAILDAAARDRIDLIALQTHGRRGLARLFMGSVADKVIRGATLPVLVQRPKEK